MVLPFLIASTFLGGRGHDVDRVLLRYHFETGDKYTARIRYVCDEQFAGKSRTLHTVIAMDEQLVQTVQKSNVDDTVNIDQQATMVNYWNWEVWPHDYDSSVHKLLRNPLGRVPYRTMIHASNQLPTASSFTELPDEPVTAGSNWEVEKFTFPARTGTARCTVTRIYEEAGHTLVRLHYKIDPEGTKLYFGKDRNKTADVPETGMSFVELIFDATEGRFLSGEGQGKLTSQFHIEDDDLKYFDHCNTSLTARFIFTKGN